MVFTTRNQEDDCRTWAFVYNQFEENRLWTAHGSGIAIALSYVERKTCCAKIRLNMRETTGIILLMMLLVVCGILAAQEAKPGASPSIEERFKQLDRNGDGKLSADEAAPIPQRRLEI